MLTIANNRRSIGERAKEPELTRADEPIEDLAIRNQDAETVRGGYEQINYQLFGDDTPRRAPSNGNGGASGWGISTSKAV